MQRASHKVNQSHSILYIDLPDNPDDHNKKSNPQVAFLLSKMFLVAFVLSA